MGIFNPDAIVSNFLHSHFVQFHTTPLNSGQVFLQGKGKTAKEVLKWIDYGGSLFLLMRVC